MEEILVFIFQVFLEMIVQLLLEVPWDLALGAGERRADARNREPRYVAWALGSLLAGAIVGGLSLWVAPHTFIRRGSVRIVYLFLAPSASAFVAFRFSQRSQSRQRPWNRPGMHAVCAFLFTLAVAMLRFVYAER